ncbi:hypothetical protein NQD34_007553 [Periophthalmus magnuspinnatus]|nr:hypothetical protein NQD34_007553 [Periophthalmus magnuspinnatus]
MVRNARTCDTCAVGCHLITGLPSGPTKNFSKFHLMSFNLSGSQKSLPGTEPKESPTGGQALCTDKN